MDEKFERDKGWKTVTLDGMPGFRLEHNPNMPGKNYRLTGPGSPGLGYYYDKTEAEQAIRRLLRDPESTKSTPPGP